jgi:hypothetical protein
MLIMMMSRKEKTSEGGEKESLSSYFPCQYNDKLGKRSLATRRRRKEQTNLFELPNCSINECNRPSCPVAARASLMGDSSHAENDRDNKRRTGGDLRSISEIWCLTIRSDE